MTPNKEHNVLFQNPTYEMIPPKCQNQPISKHEKQSSLRKTGGKVLTGFIRKKWRKGTIYIPQHYLRSLHQTREPCTSTTKLPMHLLPSYIQRKQKANLQSNCYENKSDSTENSIKSIPLACWLLGTPSHTSLPPTWVLYLLKGWVSGWVLACTLTLSCGDPTACTCPTQGIIEQHRN